MSHQMNEDLDIVAIWLRKDPIRWLAGAVAGAFACLVAIAFAMILAKGMGYEIWFPIKAAALPLLGNQATEFGMNGKAIITGLLFSQIICIFWGVMYAHFTGTNRMGPLLAMGLVWGAFSWIFLTNLYANSFREYMWAQIPKGSMFFVTLVFGITLSSVSLFDRFLRSDRR